MVAEVVERKIEMVVSTNKLPATGEACTVSEFEVFMLLDALLEGPPFC